MDTANKIVLPGEMRIPFYCALSSAHCRPVRGVKLVQLIIMS